jgi:hypothetical protein
MNDFDVEVIKWLVMGAFGFVVWWLKNSITKLQADVENIKAEYLHKDDFKEFKQDLFRSLEEIKRDIRRLLDFKDTQ